MPPRRRRRWLANPRNRQRAAVGATLAAALLAVGVAVMQSQLTPGSVAYAWMHLGYVVAVAVGVLAVVWETQAAMAFADFAPQAVGRRARMLLAAGLCGLVPGCVGLMSIGDGVVGGVALGLLAGGIVGSVAGLAILLVTRGADYAGRKIDERAQDEW